jgi:hypothetical protein
MFLQLTKKNNLAILSIIVFAFFVSFFVFNFSVKSQNETESYAIATVSPSETPHNLVGTYYNLRDYSGKFLLNNKGIEPITVYATLYNMSGQSITIPPETVNASSHRLIDLNNWASQGGESFKEGSIKIFHTGKDLVLGTQIYLENDNESFSFDEKLAELTKFDTRKQEAVWWMPNRQTDVKIALSNTSDTVLSINATLSRKPKKVGVTENFTLQPHQTRLLDLRNDFTDGSQFDNHDVIGLSLEHAGAKDALLARIMLKNETFGYSNVVQFSNPNTAKSNEYQGVGFHIDKLGGTQLEPIIIAKNVGTVNSNVQIKIPYTRNNGTTNTIILPIEKLKAGEMLQIDASQITNIALQENIKIAGIEITYDTPNGSVIAATHSISPNRNQVYRVPMWDPLQQRSPTGGYPWRIEPTSTTKAYIKNITDQEEDYVAFLLWENGGEYMIGLKAIKPHQSIEIDVKKLRNDQTPDERGRIIPLNINNGQLQWTLRRKDNLPDDDAKANLALVGRSEQIDFVKNVSSNYACQNCCTGDFVSGRIVAATQDQNQPIPQGETRFYFAVEEQQSCYGGYYGFIIDDVIENAVWNTGNSNVATVTGGAVSGINPGNATITASWRPYTAVNYTCSPSQLAFISEGINCNETSDTVQLIKPRKDEEPIITPKVAACGSCVLLRWQTPFTAFKTVSVTPTPIIKIFRNGQDITSTPQNQNVQTVTVGEKISLSATVTGGTASNNQWVIPGNRIANYVDSLSSAVVTQLGSTNQTSVTYYWVDGEDGRQVDYSVTVNNSTYSAHASFDVKKPNVSVTPSRSPFIGIVERANGQRFFAYGDSGFTPGVALQGVVSPATNGSFQWIQIYNENKTLRLTTKLFGCGSGTIAGRNGAGLDTSYPYRPGLLLEDSPDISLTMGFDRVTVNDSASAYLMFRSNTSDSIWIPMKVFTWTWGGLVERPNVSNNDWFKINSFNPLPFEQVGASFPEWQRNVASNSWICQ